jgi:hypothetical protein
VARIDRRHASVAKLSGKGNVTNKVGPKAAACTAKNPRRPWPAFVSAKVGRFNVILKVASAEAAPINPVSINDETLDHPKAE